MVVSGGYLKYKSSRQIFETMVVLPLSSESKGQGIIDTSYSEMSVY